MLFAFALAERFRDYKYLLTRLEASLSEFGPNETGIRARNTAPQEAAWRSVLLMYSSPGLVRIIMEHGAASMGSTNYGVRK